MGIDYKIDSNIYNYYVCSNMDRLPTVTDKLVYVEYNSMGMLRTNVECTWTGERDGYNGEYFIVIDAEGKKYFAEFHHLKLVSELTPKPSRPVANHVEKVCKICGTTEGRYTTIAGGDICDDCL